MFDKLNVREHSLRISHARNRRARADRAH